MGWEGLTNHRPIQSTSERSRFEREHTHYGKLQYGTAKAVKYYLNVKLYYAVVMNMQHIFYSVAFVCLFNVSQHRSLCLSRGLTPFGFCAHYYFFFRCYFSRCNVCRVAFFQTSILNRTQRWRRCYKKWF